MKPFRTFVESFVSPDSNTESETGYFYHATNEDHAADIAQTGLKVFPPHHGTDQSCWPDGKRDKRAYLSASANKVWMFAPEDGKAVILRTKRAVGPFKQEMGTGDIYTTQPIPAKALEVLQDTGWTPLQSAF